METSPARPEMVSVQAQLDGVCRRIRQCGWFSFDTEFVGEDQFKPEVCLIQVAIDNHCAIVDPLSGLDTRPLWDLIADDNVAVLVHAGAEEMRLCLREIARPPANVFDLQIAAGFVGLGYPLSLSRLMKLVLGRTLHKGHTLTNWRKRPLSQEQITYAVEDVVHLRPLQERIVRQLRDLNREAWVREECEAACRPTPQNDERVSKLRRLKGSGGLTRRQLAIAHALLDTREELAAEYNRPVRTVLQDHLVVEIARSGWTNPQRIRQLRGVNLRSAAVERLAQSVEAAGKLPEDQWPVLPSLEDTPDEDVLIGLIMTVLKDFCRQNQLAYSLLATKQDIKDLVRSRTRPSEAQSESAFSHGWRREAVGQLLADVIAGRKAVRVASSGPAGRLLIE